MQEILSNDNYTATINLKGAELISYKNHIINKEYIWDGNPEFWNKHSPVLFPIVGTLKDNSYFYDGKKYELPRHGFARDKDFEIIGKEANLLLLSLSYDDETLKVYPFKFKLQILYRLSAQKIIIHYFISKSDSFNVPFSIGGHPAFALAEKFENYSLEFENQETLECFPLENNLLSDKSQTIKLKNGNLPLTYSQFLNDALVIKSLDTKIITILENNKEYIRLRFPKFNNLGIWTKPNAPFICIEPWLGYSDTVNSNGNILEKEGIQILDSNIDFDCQFSIEIL